MRFDSSIFWHTKKVIPWHIQVDEYREYGRALEALGFTTAWVAEHHLWHDGFFSTATNPIMTGLGHSFTHQNVEGGTEPNLDMRLAPDPCG